MYRYYIVLYYIGNYEGSRLVNVHSSYYTRTPCLKSSYGESYKFHSIYLHINKNEI